MRRHAALARRVLIESRVRAGEDPLEIIAELPALEDDLVIALRDDALDAEGLGAQYALARMLERDASRPDAAYYREQADAIDARLFRAIGLEHPTLTRAAWRALAALDADPS